MKKILLALGAGHLSRSAFEFVRNLSEAGNMLVTGIQLPSLIKMTAWAATGGEDAYLIPELTDEEERLQRAAIREFKEACIGNNIEFRIHAERHAAVTDIIRKETRFADLLVLSYENHGIGWDKELLDEELREIIRFAECPVLLLPETLPVIDNIIIAYDGSGSSVLAVKMFSYLFPGMTTLKTMIVHADANDSFFPEEDHIKEFAARHFSDLSLAKLEFEGRKYFATWLLDRKNALLITGSFGRSEISVLWKKSFLAGIIAARTIPVFIAHR